MSSRRQALGRGLGSLLGNTEVSLQDETPREVSSGNQIHFISIEDIFPNPHQPRQRFSQDSLRELADSITSHGVLQPILVTPKRSGDEGYVLLAGERRFRAAQLANLEKIPALVTEATEEDMLEIALVENVQRDDLNSVEEARAYKSLMNSFGWSQEQVANRVGKKRSTVANALRLLNLGPLALKDLEDGRLTSGHARSILSLEDETQRERLRLDIVNQGLSVREAERRVQQINERLKNPPAPKPKKKKSSDQQGLDTLDLEERLMTHLGCRVKIKSRDGRSGSLEIPFRDPDELQRFLDAVGFLD